MHGGISFNTIACTSVEKVKKQRPHRITDSLYSDNYYSVAQLHQLLMTVFLLIGLDHKRL